MPRKFDSYLKSYVIQPDRNIFIHPDDPDYFKKMTKYIKPNNLNLYYKLAKDGNVKGILKRLYFTMLNY